MENRAVEGLAEVRQQLDRLLGKVDALILQHDAQDQRVADRLDDLAERTVRLEQGVGATRDIVEAWAAAKTSLRFLGWAAGIAAAVASALAALRGWLHR